MPTAVPGTSAEKEVAPIPAKLGKYPLICHLATGGMAEIFLARASGIERFEKLVVLKRILPELATHKEIVELFLDEARLAATLAHSNIVQVYDVGIADGSYFFTMEFVHGEDVRALLNSAAQKQMPIPMDVGVAIILGVCAGLQYAHDRAGFDGQPLGIIHRDVSPSNVLVSYEGLVKLVDFGIAKASSRSAETQHGSVRGKFGYMSPEQCEAKPLDRRSDVFAIAIVLYELATQTKLYKAGSDYQIMKQVVEHNAPLPSSRIPDYPPELERIVMKGLARNPDERYATAEELQLDLEEFARRRQLKISTVTVARFMEKLFGKKIAEWKAAQKHGTPLEDHLAVSLVATPSFAEATGRGSDETRPEKGLALASRDSASTAPKPRGARASLTIAGVGVGLALIAVAAVVSWPLHKVEVVIPVASNQPPAAPVALVVPPIPSVAQLAVDGGAAGNSLAVVAPGLAVTPPLDRSRHVRRSGVVSRLDAARPSPRPSSPPEKTGKPKPEWDPDSPVPP